VRREGREGKGQGEGKGKGRERERRGRKGGGVCVIAVGGIDAVGG